MCFKSVFLDPPDDLELFLLLLIYESKTCVFSPALPKISLALPVTQEKVWQSYIIT